MSRLLHLQDKFQGSPFTSEPRQGQSKSEHVPADPPVGSVRIIGPDLVAERTVDGDNYIRFCPRHQWAGRETYSIDATAHQQCPKCSWDLDGDHGQLRYRLLHMRLKLEA